MTQIKEGLYTKIALSAVLAVALMDLGASLAMGHALEAVHVFDHHMFAIDAE